MINYVVGDATEPLGSGPRLIVHVCNNIGAWGAGFVLALSRKWAAPEVAYRAQHKLVGLHMGDVTPVHVEPMLFVVNMVAQRGVRTDRMQIPLDYEALDICLGKVAQYRMDAAKIPGIHMPRIGCGLAGGTWAKVEPLLQKHFNNHNVTVYDLS